MAPTAKAKPATGPVPLPVAPTTSTAKARQATGPVPVTSTSQGLDIHGIAHVSPMAITPMANPGTIDSLAVSSVPPISRDGIILSHSTVHSSIGSSNILHILLVYLPTSPPGQTNSKCLKGLVG